jgi:hypothetical protein
MKKLTALLIIIAFLTQNAVFAIAPATIKTLDVSIKRQSKEQYPYKKVLKNYDPYLITITNNGKTPLLITTSTTFHFELRDGTEQQVSSRRDLYRKVRYRDIGRNYWIGTPCDLLAGAVIGATFGLGIPVGIGLIIIGHKPAFNAAAKNSEIGKDLYEVRKIPLRFEPDETYLVRVFIPKETLINKVILTDLVYENSTKKVNIEIPFGGGQ